MQRMFLLLMTLALALAIGCNQNRASNKSGASTGAGGDTSGTAADNNNAAGTAGTGSSSSAKLSDSEKQLLQQVADADRAEVQMGQLAQTNASSDKVKQLGQMLVDDHKQNSQQVQQLAQQKGVELKDEPKPDEQSAMSKLEKTKGAQFDKAFLQHERDDHAKLLKQLQQQQDQVNDPDLKSFVTQTINAVQQHLQQTEGSKATSTSPSGQ
jgi:putative membrane protein